MSEHRLSSVVIERPRSGMRCSSRKLKGIKKTLNQLTQEATQDGLLNPYLIKVRQGSKSLSDHLGPLRRLLRSKVGQPWDQVYSELCQRLDQNTIAGQHVIDHLWHYVERHVEIIDGIPYHKCKQRYRFRQLGHFYDQFYIHSETRVLCIAQKIPKTTPQQCNEQRNDRWVIDFYHQYRNLNGVWYFIAFEDLPCAVVRDAILKVSITPEIAWKEYGRSIYASHKRQCSKREIKMILEHLAHH